MKVISSTTRLPSMCALGSDMVFELLSDKCMWADNVDVIAVDRER